MAKLGQKFNKYSKEFRLSIVEECLKENEKVRTIAIKFGINRNTIESWIRSYKFGKLNTKSGRQPGNEEDLLEFWKNKCELMEKVSCFCNEKIRKKIEVIKKWRKKYKINLLLEALKVKR
ncbi:transposase [Spiroplasma endosymbiont of Atherix ibis]|uniref:transposase n=1 Tax=Spiroplasma endosymbiont of Atherix ibis TaxID=3066291 RepID=UPI0030D0602E